MSFFQPLLRGAVLIGAALLALTGCGVVDPVPEYLTPDPCEMLRAEIVPPLSVVLDARMFEADTYHWDLGDGTIIEDGPGLLHHTYAEPGSYPVLVFAEWADGNGGGGNGGGPAIGGGGGDVAPGDTHTDSGYIVVRVGDDDGPQAVVVALRNNQPSTAFWAWDEPTFWGGASRSDSAEDLWYQWAAQRRYKVDGSWAPWHVPQGYEDRHRHQGETWEPGAWLFMVPGDELVTPTPSTIQYRITLIITDAFGRQDTTSVILTVHTGC